MVYLYAEEMLEMKPGQPLLDVFPHLTFLYFLFRTKADEIPAVLIL
jgi:hypothetical protein